MSNEEQRQACELGLIWDARLRGQAIGLAENDLLQIVDRLEAENRAVSLGQAEQDRIWSAIMAGTVDTLSGRAHSDSYPGRSRDQSLSRAIGFLHAYAWLLCAGMVGGFAAGVGSRLTMRLAGYLTIEQNRALLTENEERVGEITLGGTLALGLIGGALGVFALLFYVLIRDRLPFDGFKRSVTFAWLLFLVFGYVVMDPSNPDYHRFGPAWMNVVTFSSLYLVMGVCVVQTYEFGLRWTSRHSAMFGSGRSRAMTTMVSTAVCIVGTVQLMAGLFVGFSAVLIPLLAAATWAVGRVIGPDLIAKVQMPFAVRHWGTWVVPGIVGFILTARGVTEILLNR
jgi:hypothetical protein